MAKNFTIYFPKDLLTLSGCDLAVYSYLSALSFNYVWEDTYINIHTLQYRMGEKRVTKIKESMETLMKTGYFDIKSVSKSEYLLQNESFKQVPSPFIKCNFNDIKKIVSSNNQNKYNLVKLYIHIVASMDFRIKDSIQNPFLTYMPLSYFVEKLEVTRTETISSYERALEIMDIIYVYRGDHKTNIIGYYDHKEEIERFGDAKYGKQSTKTNDRRSLMQKYNWMQRGKRYSPEETEEIHQYVIQYNHNMQALQDRFPEGDYKAKIKDLTVFNIDKITA